MKERYKNQESIRKIEKTIRLNDEEKAIIEEISKKHNLSIAMYMREVALNPQDFVREIVYINKRKN